MKPVAKQPSLCIVHNGNFARAARWQQHFTDAGWCVHMADLSKMRQKSKALPAYPPYICAAKLAFDFFQGVSASFDAVIFTETGTASYYCGKVRKAIPSICNAVLVADMGDCLEWKLFKNKEPIRDLDKLFTVEFERTCAELADIVLLDKEQAHWLENKGWNLTAVNTSQEEYELERFLRRIINGSLAHPDPVPPHDPHDSLDTLISVVIPTYNRPTLLRRAVDSVLGQTWKQIELIIVDDGSTDPAVPPLLDQLEKDPVITVLRQENKHVSAARNAGIRAARGEHIAFLDDDNILSADFLGTCLNVLRKTGADVCIPGMRVENVNETYFLGGGSSLMAQCALNNVFGDTCCLARRAVFLEHPFPETRAGAEDWAVFTSIFLSGKNIVCWPEPLLQYQYTPGSITAQRDKYAYFRAHCLPLEAAGRRSLTLLSEVLAFQPRYRVRVWRLMRRLQSAILQFGKLLVAGCCKIAKRLCAKHGT